MNSCFVVYWKKKIGSWYTSNLHELIYNTPIEEFESKKIELGITETDDYIEECVKTFDELVDAVEYARELGETYGVSDIKVFDDGGRVCIEIN